MSAAKAAIIGGAIIVSLLLIGIVVRIRRSRAAQFGYTVIDATYEEGSSAAKTDVPTIMALLGNER